MAAESREAGGVSERPVLEQGETAFRAYHEKSDAEWGEMSALGKAQWARAEAAVESAYAARCGASAQAPESAR